MKILIIGVCGLVGNTIPWMAMDNHDSGETLAGSLEHQLRTY